MYRNRGYFLALTLTETLTISYVAIIFSGGKNVNCD